MLIYNSIHVHINLLSYEKTNKIVEGREKESRRQGEIKEIYKINAFSGKFYLNGSQHFYKTDFVSFILWPITMSFGL